MQPEMRGRPYRLDMYSADADCGVHKPGPSLMHFRKPANDMRHALGIINNIATMFSASIGESHRTIHHVREGGHRPLPSPTPKFVLASIIQEVTTSM